MEAPAEAEMEGSGEMEDAGMDGGMDAGMDAGMDSGMDGGEPVEEEIDYSEDERMKLMINHISESLETFTSEEHWKKEHYAQLNTFLSNSE